MVQLISIIVIIISLVAGVYGIILLASMRKKFHFEYLNSFFYYQVLYFLFGVYGILGNVAIEKILLKFAGEDSHIAGIALFFPLFGIPFIVAAWFLFIKLSAEIINRKLPQYVAIIYFILATSFFFIYGRFMQRMPDLDYESLSQKVIVIFYTIDLSVTAYFSIVLLIGSAGERLYPGKIYLIRFALISIGLSLLKASSMHFAKDYLLIGLYFLLLFFTGNLSFILLTKVYLSKNLLYVSPQFSNIDDIYLKHGISNREREIIQEICKGKTNQEIADALFISLQTVKDHTYNIFRKVNVKNRVQLTRVFRQ